MKFPIFASVIVFCIWLGYELHKRRNLEQKARDEFWEREAAANATRRKSLEHLNYIHIPFDTLPMDVLCEDDYVLEYHDTLRELSSSCIVNLTGISNTDLKLTYGAPNIDLLSLYDQNYTTLVRTLQAWAEKLYEGQYVDEAQKVLEFAVSTHTDLSSSYKLLSSIYLEKEQKEKIEALIPIAEELNSSLKEHIVTTLKERCQNGDSPAISHIEG